MSVNFYDLRRYGIMAFLLVSIGAVALFLYYSSRLVGELSQQERSRMEIWADATRQLSRFMDGDPQSDADAAGVDFLLTIIEDNRTIPVLLTDADGHIISHRNFDLPEPDDPFASFDELSAANRQFLSARLKALQGSANVIHILITDSTVQHLYYEDSRLLRALSRYPYVQVAVLFAFVVFVYYAVSITRRAEQNKVWVGLSKETAHQLGTPISSLMAWMELLPELGVDAQTVAEMNKDVARLNTIASRFSKIGSQPQIETLDLNAMVEHSASYMATRLSKGITLTLNICPTPLPVKMSEPLAEWVMENLMKNAADAMQARGQLTITTGCQGSSGPAFVEVADTGKGIPHKHFEDVFNPGYTTKKRGWGLGLTLARRIVTDYHRGRIFVKHSEVGRGTVFRIEFPLATPSES